MRYTYNAFPQALGTMKPATEEFLYFLLWNADALMRPSWRNLNDSFEQWAWRRGLSYRLAQLEREKLLERAPGKSDEFIVRLTEAGRLAALGGRDPEERWSRHWDGHWRLVVFDLPRDQAVVRMQLWRLLRQHHFGYLQHSAWVTPDIVGPLRTAIVERHPEVESIVFIEGRPCGGESDTDIVKGAWNFVAVNEKYQRYLDLVRRPPRVADRTDLQTWTKREWRLWRDAVSRDPLLPRILLPRDYLGEKAFQKHREAIARFGGQSTQAAARSG